MVLPSHVYFKAGVRVIIYHGPEMAGCGAVLYGFQVAPVFDAKGIETIRAASWKRLGLVGYFSWVYVDLHVCIQRLVRSCKVIFFVTILI